MTENEDKKDKTNATIAWAGCAPERTEVLEVGEGVVMLRNKDGRTEYATWRLIDRLIMDTRLATIASNKRRN